MRANGGQDIFMYINGTYVNRISDYYMVGGTVGLAATSSASNFDARFDDFTFDNERPSLSMDSITSAAATTSPSDAEIAIVPLSREQHR